MTLQNKQVRDTYIGILNINDTNTQLGTSTQTVKDGLGNASPLAISTQRVVINGNSHPTDSGTDGQVLTTDGAGNLSWQNGGESIDFQNFDQNIIPDQDQVRDLGSPTRQWRDIYVGPGSLYVNGQQVLSDDSGTIVVQADANQNLSIKTTGTGNLEFAAEGTGALTFKSDINIQSGFTFYSTNSEIDFGDDINMNLSRIKGLAAPVDNSDAARKQDVDAIAIEYTPVNVAGDTMLGSLNMNSNALIGLATPVNGSDAVNKTYVDNAVAGLSWKDSVDAATTAQITRSGEQTIDGVALVSGNRVLVKDQSDQTGNGIFEVRSGVWVRTEDADNSPNHEIGGGTAVFVTGGNTNTDTGWVITSPNGTATLGTDNIVFTQFTGGTTYSEGDGIDITGNVIAVDNTVVRTSTFNSLGDPRYAQLTAQNTFTNPNNFFGIRTVNIGTNFATQDLYVGSGALNEKYSRWTSGLNEVGTGGDGNPSVNLEFVGDNYTPTDVKVISRYMRNGSGDCNQVQFILNGLNAANIEPTGTSVPDGITLITREKGDARYPQLSSTNVFSGINRIENTTFPRLVLKHTDGAADVKTWQLVVDDPSGDFSIHGLNDAESTVTTSFRFERGAGLNSGDSVVVRSAGDARYPQLNAANTFTTVNTFTGQINITTASIADCHLEIGTGRTGNGNAYIDLVSDATNTDYGTRLIREPSENGVTMLRHKGTGHLGFITENDSPIFFYRGVVGGNPVLAARISPTGTTVEDTSTVITAEKGDSRYQAISSDAALKENITDARTALPIINQLRPVEYNWINKESNDDKTHFGLIANEVEQILPSAVKEGGEGKAIDMRDLVGLLIKSVKELSAEIEELKKNK